MTVSDLIQRLPHVREMFPQFIELDWSLEEYLAAQRAWMPGNFQNFKSLNLVRACNVT